MAAEKTWGIVLRTVAFSETSVVATVFTRDFGKITGLAKGARRPKSPFESALDLMSLIRVVFLRKSTDALHLFTEARLERRFRIAAVDLDRYYAGSHVLNLLLEFTDDGDSHPEVFDAAATTICRIDQNWELADCLVWFELQLFKHLGHFPMLDVCAVCGQEVARTGRLPFGYLAGGVLCAACRPGQRHVVSLSRDGWQSLRTAAANDWLGNRRAARWEEEGSMVEELGAAPPPKMPKPVAGELRGFLNHWAAHLLGRKLDTQSWLGRGFTPVRPKPPNRPKLPNQQAAPEPPRESTSAENTGTDSHRPDPHRLEPNRPESSQ